ncbi:MAG TPA: non-homologous end-joining DNA ligase [Acidothermaceae bacterium]
MPSSKNANEKSDKTTVQVGDRRLAITNLTKILYPQTGFTKGEVLDYYARVAPVLLPHLAGRPLTRKRYPNGVDGPSFFEKNAPRGTPEWVRTVNLPVPGSTMNRETIDFVIVEDLPTLVWTANLASLELHVPQWKVGPRGGVQEPDLLVLDLDPGPPATIVECCEVALLLKEVLEADGLTGYAKTSGSKGMQLYAPLRPTPADDTRLYARSLARRLEKQRPDLVVSDMTKALRQGKVLVDWSQNAAAKTTVAPYSLRARPEPTVSTPITWDEVAACESPEELVFLSEAVLERIEADGDLLADLVTLTTKQRPKLPASASRAADGG